MFCDLYDYQNEMFQFNMANLFGKSIGSGQLADPGLGKTLVSLRTIRELYDLNEVQHALVVAPKRVCQMVWPQEIEKWDVGLSYNVLCGRVKKSLSSNPKAVIDIINPESLHLLKDYSGRWDYAVVDESTKFKNFSSKRMKSLKKLLPDLPLRSILTGTPVANSLLDMHAQAYIMDHGEALGRTLTVFRGRYAMKGGWQGRAWVPRPDASEQIMDAIKHLVLRMDAETHLDLPRLVFRNVYVELPSKLRAEYNRLKKDLLLQLQEQSIFLANAAGAYEKMRQLANGRVLDADGKAHFAHDEKLAALRDLREDLWGRPLLVAYKYVADGKALMDAFPGSRMINGQTTAAEDKETMKQWNAGKLPMLLGQIQSCSHGLNLQDGGSTDVVMYNEDNSPDLVEQVWRRVYRNGVHGEQVTVHRILTRGTVDEVIRDRLEHKGRTQSDFLNSLKEHARS